MCVCVCVVGFPWNGDSMQTETASATFSGSGMDVTHIWNISKALSSSEAPTSASADQDHLIHQSGRVNPNPNTPGQTASLPLQQPLFFGGHDLGLPPSPRVRVGFYRFGGGFAVFLLFVFAITHGKVFFIRLKCHRAWSPLEWVQNTPAAASTNDTSCSYHQSLCGWIPDLWFSSAAHNSLTCTLRILEILLKEIGKAASLSVAGKSHAAFFLGWKDRWHRNCCLGTCLSLVAELWCNYHTHNRWHTRLWAGGPKTGQVWVTGGTTPGQSRGLWDTTTNRNSWTENGPSWMSASSIKDGKMSFFPLFFRQLWQRKTSQFLPSFLLFRLNKQNWNQHQISTT